MTMRKIKLDDSFSLFIGYLSQSVTLSDQTYPSRCNDKRSSTLQPILEKKHREKEEEEKRNEREREGARGVLKFNVFAPACMRECAEKCITCLTHYVIVHTHTHTHSVH